MAGPGSARTDGGTRAFPCRREGAEMSDATTKPEAKTDPKSKLLPPYHVILMNDDFHSFDFVVMVLRKVFGVTQEQAMQFALRAHETGRSVVWTGAKEVAELKVEQMRTFH